MENILIYINHLKPGGAENQILNLVANQNHPDYKFFIITQSRYSDKSFVKKFNDTRVKIIFIDEKNKSKIMQIFLLRSLLKKYNFKVVQTYLSGDNIFCSLVTIGKSIKHITGYRGDYGNPVFKRSITQKLKDYLSWLLSDLIVSNNECGLKYLKSLPLISEDKIIFIPNGIELHEDHFENNNYNIIGCLSNFWKYKNHMTLIKAYVKIKEDYKLRLAGNGPEFEKCFEILEEYGCNSDEILMGSIYDVDKFFKGIDMFVYPSLREGSPNALLEAMSYGKFCLVSDIPENREALGYDIHNNCFFEPQNPDDLVSKILYWNENQDEMIIQAKNNKNRIMKRYSIKNLTSSFKRIYENI